MESYVIFYYLASDYDKVSVDAESFQDAVSLADAFSAESGALIVGVCSEFLLNVFCHD